MPMKVDSARSSVGSTASSGRRSRGLADIAPQYIAKSGLCAESELEGASGTSYRIQHVLNASSVGSEGPSRFPKLDECAHFHYEHVDLHSIQLALVEEDIVKPLLADKDSLKHWYLKISSHEVSWMVRRSYDNFVLLDQQLHRCIYDRKFSNLPQLPDQMENNVEETLSWYLSRLSAILDSAVNCGPVLNWLEMDNRGHHLLVPDNDTCPINTPAVAAAYTVKKYQAQAPDELSFEVGDMISVIDMPPPEESIWWRGKRGFLVGFFPCECVSVIGDKVPRHIRLNSTQSEPSKSVLRKHGKLIAFFRSFILSRPSRRRLKQSGILKERVFGCDLGEHLQNSGHEIPLVLKCCAEFIETHGIVDGIYRLSGVTSNIHKLRNAFDEDRVPALYEDNAIRQDIHSVASLLKMYFRELPNPLCTYQLYHQFVNAVQGSHSEDLRLLKMREVVHKLPPPHYRTLEYLTRHLARVAARGSDTGMTPRNVAIVWAPNLLRCREFEVGGVAALQFVGVQAVVTEFLIRYDDLIFNDKFPVVTVSQMPTGSMKKCRPKSLAISTPTKLLTLEEARNRALLNQQPDQQQYIEVGGGPASLPPRYHTVIELPRKRTSSKRSPLGWRSFFGSRGSKNAHQRKSSTPADFELMREKAVTEADLQSNSSKRRLRPAKSVESLASLTEPTGVSKVSTPMAHTTLSRQDSVNNHNRSVSHDSYFDTLQDDPDEVFESPLDMSEIQVNFDLEESEMRIFSEDETLIGSGSIGLGSPRPNKLSKSLPMSRRVTGAAARLARGEDSLSSSQSADPSPKKQKTQEEPAPGKSRLEERLSTSAGELQFIDCVSPDQIWVEAEIHPIQSPSPVSSLSRVSSLLPSNSPILPHIPHLNQSRYSMPETPPPQRRENQSRYSMPETPPTNRQSQPTERARSALIHSLNQLESPQQPVAEFIHSLSQSTSANASLVQSRPGSNQSLNQSSFTSDNHTYLLDPLETDINKNTSMSCEFIQSEVKHTDLHQSQSSIPDFDHSRLIETPPLSQSERTTPETLNLPMTSDSTLTTPDTPLASTYARLVESPEPPKPEERKQRPYHPYENIGNIKTPSTPTSPVLETSFDVLPAKVFHVMSDSVECGGDQKLEEMDTKETESSEANTPVCGDFVPEVTMEYTTPQVIVEDVQENKMESSFEVSKNRDSIASFDASSVTYQLISTESSCDSLIDFRKSDSIGCDVQELAVDSANQEVDNAEVASFVTGDFKEDCKMGVCEDVSVQDESMRESVGDESGDKVFRNDAEEDECKTLMDFMETSLESSEENLTGVSLMFASSKLDDLMKDSTAELTTESLSSSNEGAEIVPLCVNSGEPSDWLSESEPSTRSIRREMIGGEGSTESSDWPEEIPIDQLNPSACAELRIGDTSASSEASDWTTVIHKDLSDQVLDTASLSEDTSISSGDSVERTDHEASKENLSLTDKSPKRSIPPSPRRDQRPKEIKKPPRKCVTQKDTEDEVMEFVQRRFSPSNQAEDAKSPGKVLEEKITMENIPVLESSPVLRGTRKVFEHKKDGLNESVSTRSRTSLDSSPVHRIQERRGTLEKIDLETKCDMPELVRVRARLTERPQSSSANLTRRSAGRQRDVPEGDSPKRAKPTVLRHSAPMEGTKKPTEWPPKPSDAKENADWEDGPLRSSSSGNVRQLLHKFEASEKPTVAVRTEKVERPRTLERLSTKKVKDVELDLSDPERRERIERYKEKRRMYLREKYRTEETARRLPPFEKPPRKHPPVVVGTKTSPTGVAKTSSLGSVGRRSYELPTVSSQSRSPEKHRSLDFVPLESKPLPHVSSPRRKATTPTTPPYCIKDVAAMFEKRDTPSSNKQYLSSV